MAEPLPRKFEPEPDIDNAPDARAPSAEVLEELRQAWESLPPMPEAVKRAYDENVRLRWDTHSNAIEGNSLKYSDTVLLLLYGRTRGSHLIREYEELQGHDVAILHMQDLIDAGEPLTEEALLYLHKLMLVRPYTTHTTTHKGEIIVSTVNVGQYKTEPNMVMRPDNTPHPFLPPEEVPERMARFLGAVNADLEMPQADVADMLARQHHAFLEIHPFADGNGRMARLLLNFVAQSLGFPALVIEEEARSEYMECLIAIDTGDYGALRDFLAVRMRHALDFGIAVKRQECEPGYRNAAADPAMPPSGSIYDDRPHTHTGTARPGGFTNG